MKKSILYALAGGMLITGAVVAVRNCNDSTSPPLSGQVMPKPDKAPLVSEEASNTVTASMVGKLKFKEMKQEFPKGGWLGTFHPADPATNTPERFYPFPEEGIQAWTQPSAYWGEKGEFIHAEFRKGLPASISLDGKAEEKFRDVCGLAIVRAGMPSGVQDIGKANIAIFSAAMDGWTLGGSKGDTEVEITPVIVQVLFANDEGNTATHDTALVGKEIPMVLIKTGYKFGEEGVFKQTDLDNIPVEELIDRWWFLVPYSPDNRPAAKIEEVTARFTEPSLEAWKKQKEKSQ